MDQSTKDLYNRVREMSKKYDFKIITPKAPPMRGNPAPHPGVIVVDYLGRLETK